jgi:hypothetical protein
MKSRIHEVEMALPVFRNKAIIFIFAVEILQKDTSKILELNMVDDYLKSK